VVQEVEHLHGKHEALSSNSSTAPLPSAKKQRIERTQEGKKESRGHRIGG
jgi:hypothetical protein